MNRTFSLLILALAIGLACLPVLHADDEKEVENPKENLKEIEVPDISPEVPGATTPNIDVNPLILSDISPVPENLPASVVYDRSTELLRAVSTTPYPELRPFLTTYIVAFDLLQEKGPKQTRIAPVPLLWPYDYNRLIKGPSFGVMPLDERNQPEEIRNAVKKQVIDIIPFERIVLKGVEELLNPKEPDPQLAKVPADEILAAVEQVMTRTLFFHTLAVEKNQRRGDRWKPLQDALYEKLTEVRLSRVQQLGKDKNWTRLTEVSERLLRLYSKQPEIVETIYAARLAEAKELVQSERVTDLERGRQLLNDYDSRYPTSGNVTAKAIHDTLKSRAAAIMNDAQRALTQNQSQARNLLKTVEAIDPDNAQLRNMQQDLRSDYPVLVVGVRHRPELMSPTLARFDSERQAVELMFEGLMERVPDKELGVRFVPGLAVDSPSVAASVREIQLTRSAEWSGEKQGIFDAADVDGTLRLMRRGPQGWAAQPLSWLGDPDFDPNTPGQIRMHRTLGHPDPRGLLTLKMHPARWLLQQNKGIDDEAFARQPFATGPYKLDPKFVPGQPGKDVVFISNSAYSRRPGHDSEPFLKEIRLRDIGPTPDLVAEFRAGRIHILTDVPTRELSLFEANNNLGGQVRIVTAATNRRIELLAINHRRPALADPAVRRGLSLAIDRETILNEVYRAGRADVHHAMTGPFPPNSWATPTKQASLYSRDLAQAKFDEYAKNPSATQRLELLYPSDDPQIKSACERIRNMVEAASSKALTLELVPLDPRELIRRVEVEHRYDLAYMNLDYRDDWYPEALSSYLDADATEAMGRNYLGYYAKGTNPVEADDNLNRKLAAARLYSDPVGKIVPIAHEMHDLFNQASPFIPLWQLDRHMVISTSVKVGLRGEVGEVSPSLLDQTKLFQSIERWKMK